MNPSKEDVKKARLNAGLTQTEAANIVGYKLRAWQLWESGDVLMRKAIYDYFLIASKFDELKREVIKLNKDKVK